MAAALSTGALAPEPVTRTSGNGTLCLDERLNDRELLFTPLEAERRGTIGPTRFPIGQITRQEGHKQHLDKSSLDFWGISLSEPEFRLVHHPLMMRLAWVSHCTLSRSERGVWLKHSRLDHSLDVMRVATDIACNNELPPYEVKLLRYAALMHDLGHPPFAHAGEHVLTVLLKQKFDHDEFGLDLIRTTDIADILRSDGVEPEDVIRVLDDNDSRYEQLTTIVKEFADRIAYLPADVMGTSFCRELREQFLKTCKAVENSVVIENGVVYTTDPDAVQHMFACREALYREWSEHPLSALVTEVCIRGVKWAVRSDRLDLDTLCYQRDDWVMQHLDKRERAWLTEGVDNYLRAVAAYTLSDFTPEGRNIILTGQFRKALRAELGEGSTLPFPNCVYICQTHDYSKRAYLNVIQEGVKSDEKWLFGTDVPDELRFFHVSVSEDVGLEKFPELRRKAQAFLNPYLKAHATDISERIYGNIDPACYAPELGFAKRLSI